MTKIKIPRYQMRDLYNALGALDGRVEVAKDDSGKVLGLVLHPYDLGVKAVYAAARTRDYLKAEIAAIEKIQAEYRRTNGDTVKRDQELEEFMCAETEIGVHRIRIEDLKIEANKLPTSVLSNLLCMVDGEL